MERIGQGQFIDLSMQDITAWLTQASWNNAFADRVEPTVVPVADGYVFVEDGAAALARVLPADELRRSDRAAAVAALGSAGVKAVQVQTVREATEMRHTIERRLWFTMTDEGTVWPMLGSPLRLTATPPTVRHLAAPKNRDRAALLAEIGLAPALLH